MDLIESKLLVQISTMDTQLKLECRSVVRN